MRIRRISASSYSNTAPLVWSFLYGKNHGQLELILDNAPARSAELLAQDRVDAALVPVICAQIIDDVRLIPGVCVGARDKVRSVCLVTDGKELADVRSVALDTSSRTSSVLTKIIFREFIGNDPTWIEAEPKLEQMLTNADAALLIGDPALTIAKPQCAFKVFDLAELWYRHTGLGFVFAMWMTRLDSCSIDFAAARDEGLAHIDEIASNYSSQTGLSRDELARYLTENISYSIDDEMRRGMELYFKLAAEHGYIENPREIVFV